MPEIIRVGLIGYGMAGQVFHAPIITSVPGLHLAKIRETKPANIQLANQRYPLAEVVADTKAILEDGTISVVVIATPNHTHYALAEAALLARKHVVVDKPFTVTSAEADALISLATRQNCLLTVHHNRRWDSNAKTLRRIVASQLLGRLVELEIHYDRFRNYFRPGAWREENIPGSGIFYDLGPHMIDETQLLFGLPLAITADERIQRTGGKTIDNFSVVLDYEDLKVTLKGGMLVREPGPTYQLLGEQGSYVKYGMDVQEEALKAGLTPIDKPDWGIEPKTNWGKINTKYQGLHLAGTIQSEPGDYREFYANVYAAVMGQEPLAVTPEQARNTIRMIELARQSSAEKRTIPWSYS